MKPRWPLLFALPLLGALLYTLQRMDNGAQTAAGGEASGPPRYTLSGATLTRYDADGDPALRGTAEQIVYFDDQSARATTLHLDLLGDDDVTWTLDSPTGSMPAGQNRYLLEGPAAVSTHWPDTGEAVQAVSTQVWVDPDTRQFFSATPVSVRSESRNGDAVGMRANWQFRRLQLLRDVRMSYAEKPR